MSSPEQMIQMVRWRLGLPFNGDQATLEREWAALGPRQEKLADDVAVEVAQLLRLLMRATIAGKPSPDHLSWALPMIKAFASCVQMSEATASPQVAEKLKKVVKHYTDPAPPPPPRQPPQPPPPRTPIAAEKVRVGPPAPPPLRPPSPPPTRPVLARPAARPPAPITVPPPMTPPPPPAAPVSPTAAWKYIPPPGDADEPDPHAEYDARPFAAADAGFVAFGARVRGKKHKHEGTHCDDWFEVDTAGPWTLVAVSDGAGSKKFSRVGARAACGEAVRSMAESLGRHKFADHTTLADWQTAIQPDGNNVCAAADVEAVPAAVRKAITDAHRAVMKAASARYTRPEYEKVLGRPIDPNDLSCTLLLAAHRLVVIDGRPLSFIAACQVGDGMIGAVRPDGMCRVLGVADSGGYSGETEFLTSNGKADPAALLPKSVVFISPLQALLVMTDGVADDYFPPDENLPRLWADLMVNNIPGVKPPTDDAVASALANTKLPTPDAVKAADFEVLAEVVEDHPRTPVTIRSAATFAGHLGVPMESLIRSGPLLWAGATLRGGGIPGDKAADRLRLWLDAYHIRGSFDDRTLVALHREELP